jgi:predicted nucleic acid-binding protein
MKAVYVETTIVSYLVARPSRDLIVAAHQELTREWWDTERGKYTLVVSPVVLAEAEAGDPDPARRRLDALTGCEVLRGCAEIDALADRIQPALGIPEAKKLDAFHLAYAVFYRIPYLLTWNCTHLADPEVELGLARFCIAQDLWVPVVCTPEHLLSRREEATDVEGPHC